MNTVLIDMIDPGTRALIFDCDGTLADTLPAHYVAWRETAAQFGFTISEEEHERYTGIPTEGIVRILSEQQGVKVDASAFAAVKEGRFRELLHLVKPIAAVVAVARHFAGKLPMAVVSGGVRRNVELTLAAIDLAGVFDAIITADDPVAPKPSPAIFIEAARRLALPPAECLVFEDARSGIAAAVRAGMRVVNVRDYLGLNR